MVTNTTIYTRQIYCVLHDDPPPADIEFHNGDELVIIDQDTRKIFDEENQTWRPIPMSGGGGGGGDPYAIARSLLDGTATEYVDDTITYLRDGAFYGSAATTIRCHAVTRIGTSTTPITFQKCAVTALAFPNLTGGTRRFDGAASLQRIDLGAGLTSITMAEFFQCANLNTLVLRKADGVVSLASTNSFNGTPFASGGSGGTIYIPQSLYAHLGDGTSLDYKAATNWATYNGYGTITWAAIEGSVYETQYADGTPIS